MRQPLDPAVITVIQFHTSFLIGAISYAMKGTEPNRTSGIRTPATLRDREVWKHVHARASRIVPVISACCIALALTGIWVKPLQSVSVYFAMVFVQIATLLWCSRSTPKPRA